MGVLHQVRRAGPEDAGEVLRLRQMMIDAVRSEPTADWHAESLAALVAGTLEYRIGRAGDPRGTVGYVFSVATEPGLRRRGYARACMEELLAWFRERGAALVHLTASAEAEPLYASMGFARKPDPLMELRL
ncbi:GNAT family N-acetyltransferase [Streptomyces pharetrae]|uniref:GNAT family N-acetyltransferase n=1 Tax=Streptomyces pharetrae TaxID=291370 RepID=UPI00335767D6